MNWDEQQNGPERADGDQTLIHTRERVVVRSFLQQRAPHFLEAYDSICAIFEGLKIPAAQYLAAHLIRDFINFLPAAILRGSAWESELHNPPNWRDAWIKLGELTIPEGSMRNPSDNLNLEARKHLDETTQRALKDKSKMRSSELIIRSQLIPGELPEQVIGPIRELEDIRSFFINHAHLRESEIKHLRCASLDIMHARFQRMEVILAHFLGGTASSLSFLNQWLAQQDPAKLDDILSRTLTPALAMQFWNGLTNPELIVPLSERGRIVASVKVNIGDDGSYSVMQSPSLRALAKLTPQKPEEALRVWQSLPIELHVDLHHLIDAASNCQGNIVAQFGNLITQHIKNGIRPFIERDVFELIAHLVQNDSADSACKLLDAMLTLVKDDSRSYDRIQLAKCDNHDVRDVETKAAIKELALALPQQCIELLCRRIRFCDKINDYWIGLTSIDDDDDNSDWSAAVVMVGLLRDCVAWCVEADRMSLDDILKCLDPNKRVIDQRLHIYFIAKYGTDEQANELLGNYDYFDDVRIKNEMANLFKQRFSQAPQTVKDQVSAWISAGPQDGQEEIFFDHWRLCKLSWIRESLTGVALAEFEELRSQFDEDALSLADRSSHMSSGWGHVSPFSVEELAAMPIGEVIDKVKSWTPGRMTGFRSPSMEGLADTFAQVIAKQAALWSASAMQLIGMKPYFISRALNAWVNYAKDHDDLDWSQLMDLVDYILAQPVQKVEDEISEEKKFQILETDWKWARRHIAELISKACDQGVDQVLRPRFLNALQAMVDDDPESSIISDKEILKRDHASDALNSSRGKVAAALCDLAEWSAKADPKWNAAGARFVGSPGAIDDVFSLITHHFNDASNANAATWAAYAFRINQLRWFNPDWFKQLVVNKINLATTTDDQCAPWAFWLTFLAHQNTHHVWLAALGSCYEFTAEWLREQSQESQDEIEGLSHYFEHLMIYYWQGKLELDDAGLIARAFKNAAPNQRMKAMLFVGGRLNGNDEPPEDVCQRFRALWEWYWNAYATADLATRHGDNHRRSLFGNWIASGYLGKEWSIQNYLNYLKLDAEADHIDDAVERLAEWCSEFPLLVLRAARLLIAGDRNGWRMYHWKDSIIEICAQTKLIDNPDVNNARAELIEVLLRRGYNEFLDEG